MTAERLVAEARAVVPEAVAVGAVDLGRGDLQASVATSVAAARLLEVVAIAVAEAWSPDDVTARVLREVLGGAPTRPRAETLIVVDGHVFIAFRVAEATAVVVAFADRAIVPMALALVRRSLPRLAAALLAPSGAPQGDGGSR